MTAPVKPQPIAWTVAIMNVCSPGAPDVYGQFATEEDATAFAQVCRQNGIPTFDGRPNDVHSAFVIPILPATVPALAYHYELYQHVWNEHSNDLGDFCGWSGQPAPNAKDDDRCPAGCQASVSESTE